MILLLKIKIHSNAKTYIGLFLAVYSAKTCQRIGEGLINIVGQSNFSYDNANSQYIFAQSTFNLNNLILIIEQRLIDD